MNRFAGSGSLRYAGCDAKPGSIFAATRSKGSHRQTIAQSLDRLELHLDLPTVRVLLDRAGM
jgi:hypothetical protein